MYPVLHHLPKVFMLVYFHHSDRHSNDNGAHFIVEKDEVIRDRNRVGREAYDL